MMPPLLEVKSLTVQYESRATPSVECATFELMAGEICGLAGKSGSGKSTLCRALVNVLPSPGRITSGEIRFRGADLLSLSNPQMRHIRGRQIAVISQDPEQVLNPVMRVGRQVGEVLLSHKIGNRDERHRRTEELFRLVGLEERGAHSAYPHELSGGQRQRVVIAQALAAGPQILIADEPTSALDSKTEKLVTDLLINLKEQFGLTILFVSHDPVLLNQLANRVLTMGPGRFSNQTGRADALLLS